MGSQNIEFRAVIKFLTKEGAKAKEIHWCISDVYGDSSLKYSTVAKWSAEFKRGRDSLEDDPRPGCLLCQVGTQKPEHARSSAKGGVKSKPSGSVQCQSRRLSHSSCNSNETWLHHWDPDTKKESMQWKHPGSPPPKKFRTQPASKAMATVSKGIILIDYKTAGTSTTGEYYANVIK